VEKIVQLVTYSAELVFNFGTFLIYYLRQGGYVFVILCLLATLRTNFQTDLDEIFREGWQWASEQIITFWW